VRGLGHGFTTRASCLFAAGATALVCGLLLGERDLLRAGLLALVVPLVAAFVVHRSQLRIGNRRSVEPTRASAGEPVTVHLTITNHSALPTGSLMLEDRLPERLEGRARFVLDPLRSREARTVSYRIPALGRGRYRVGPLRIRLTDPFHMIDVTRSFTTTSDFVVTPVVEQLGTVEPPRSQDIGDNAGSHSIGVHGADDASTREYRTGDDLRKIHWRSSARTGVLMVRQEERPWQGQASILLDTRADAHVRGPGAPGADERLRDSAEWAISAAASIGVGLLRAGRDVWLLSDPSAPERLRFGSATRYVNHLAAISTRRRADLVPLAGPVRAATRDSVVVALLGRMDGRSLEALADAHPRAWAAPAYAVLLDVDTWADQDAADQDAADQHAADQHAADHDAAGREGSGARNGCEAAALMLRNAGWRVAVARRGDPVRTVWRTLLDRTSSPLVSP
jgi:uncharacterized protein (DUF58 family)